MKVITNLYATAAICSFTYLITPNVAYAVQSCNYEVERAKIESIIDDNYRKLSEVRNLIFSKNLQGNQNLVRKYDGLIERILGNIEKEMKSMLSDSGEVEIEFVCKQLRDIIIPDMEQVSTNIKKLELELQRK